MEMPKPDTLWERSGPPGWVGVFFVFTMVSEITSGKRSPSGSVRLPVTALAAAQNCVHPMQGDGLELRDRRTELEW